MHVELSRNCFTTMAPFTTETPQFFGLDSVTPSCGLLYCS